MKRLSPARIVSLGSIFWLVVLGCRTGDLIARANPTATRTVTRTLPRPTFTPAPPTALPTIPPPPPPPSGEVIVDDRGPGWRAGGVYAWHDAPVGIGNHSFWTLNNTYSSAGYNWARWYPTLPAPGYYEVFAFLPDRIATTLNARYWIYHHSRYDLAPRAQGFYENQWISLGTYYFNALGGEYVSLADVTYECYFCRVVAFDAVKFVPR